MNRGRTVEGFARQQNALQWWYSYFSDTASWYQLINFQ
jgi:hypothetical protein